MKRSILFTAVVLALVIGSSSAAYSKVIAVTHARIYTETTRGVLANATLLMDAGWVVAMGTNIAIPKGAELIDAQGGEVTPGLFNGHTHMGLEEVSAVMPTDDFSSDNERISASFRPTDGFNPSSQVIPQNRINGLTHALVVPESEGSLIAGQVGLVNLSGSYHSVLSPFVAMAVTLGESGKKLAGGARADALQELREALEDARDFAAHQADFNARERRSYALSRLDLKALGPVVRGEIPLLVAVHRAADIVRLLDFAKEMRVKVILSGAEEAWRVADRITAAKVTVIIDPIADTPALFETLAAREDNAAILNRAGVRLIFTGMGWQSTHNGFLVRQSAGNAVANGLPKAVAIAAMTSTPAAVFKMRAQFGRISVGAAADLVVWDGDALEVTSNPILVMLKGRRVAMVSHATRLRDRYLKRINATLQKTAAATAK